MKDFSESYIAQWLSENGCYGEADLEKCSCHACSIEVEWMELRSEIERLQRDNAELRAELSTVRENALARMSFVDRVIAEEVEP